MCKITHRSGNQEFLIEYIKLNLLSSIGYVLSTFVAARVRVLYTDYNYALIYTCTDEELAGGQCPSVHRHVAIYGRRKAGQIPGDVKERIFAAANEACVYEEDFVPATHVGQWEYLFYFLIICLNFVYLFLVYFCRSNGDSITYTIQVNVQLNVKCLRDIFADISP